MAAKQGTSLAVSAPSVACAALENHIVVIGEQYLVQRSVDLKLQQKSFTLAENNFSITDVYANLIFKLEEKLFSIRGRRTLLDANGNPVVSLRQKIMTAHRRWQVFKGESNDSSDLLFSVKKSSLFQFNTTLDVSLASNTSESVPDFKIKGTWLESACTIYVGETIIAEMHRNHNMQSLVFDKDSYGLTVNPNVDYAFITILVILLDEINDDHNGSD